MLVADVGLATILIITVIWIIGSAITVLVLRDGSRAEKTKNGATKNQPQPKNTKTLSSLEQCETDLRITANKLVPVDATPGSPQLIRAIDDYSKAAKRAVGWARFWGWMLGGIVTYVAVLMQPDFQPKYPWIVFRKASLSPTYEWSFKLDNSGHAESTDQVQFTNYSKFDLTNVKFTAIVRSSGQADWQHIYTADRIESGQTVKWMANISSRGSDAKGTGELICDQTRKPASDEVVER